MVSIEVATDLRVISIETLSLGLVAIESRFVGSNPMQDLAPERRRFRDVVDKYVAVRQPIPVRPPDGLNLPRLVWGLCKRWNDEFLKKKL